MEDTFKQKLLSLRNPLLPKTFAEALLGEVPWARKKKASAAAPAAPSNAPQFSERKQVIESFERFAQEQVQDAEVPVIKISGGEVHLKQTPGWEVPLSKDLTELRSHLSFAPQILDLIFQGRTPGQVEILFVTESFRSLEEIQADLKEGQPLDLLVSFPRSTAEFFGRMVGAMKLKLSEILLYPVQAGDKDVAVEVMTVAAHFRPQLIVTLGALPTTQILKGNDRLSMIHGQFFTRHIHQVGDFSIVPLFHPSILETNLNMKKTAWADMQKIMKHLKKLP